MKFSRYLTSAFCAVFCSSCATPYVWRLTDSNEYVSNEKFFLIDNESKQPTPPIIFTNGAQVAIGSRTYSIRLSDDKATQMLVFMRRVMIPSIEFREATIPDVINFLVAASQGGIDEPRVNMVLHEVADRTASSVQTINLQLSHVSLYDALGIICQNSRMKFQIDNRGFVQITPID